mgnify:CR=1 FL=1
MELPINHKETVFSVDSIFGNNLTSKQKTYDFNVELGINRTNSSLETFDIKNAPHILIGGTTNSGKSVFMNSLICSLISKNSPSEIQLVLIDPKQVELAAYASIPHLICPVINNTEHSLKALRWLVSEMERRYTILKQHEVKDVEELRDETGIEMTSIVCIIDELANLIRKNNQALFENLLMQLAEKARASGIHLIVGTQRPSIGAVKGDLKSNFPTRIAFKVGSSIDSRIIIDQKGAESLLGKGDMLVVTPNSDKTSRIQSLFINKQDIKGIVNFWKARNIQNNYLITLEESTVTSSGIDLDALLKEQIESYKKKAEENDANFYNALRNRSNSTVAPVEVLSEKDLYAKFLSFVECYEDINIKQIMRHLQIDERKAKELSDKIIASGKAYRDYPGFTSAFAARDKIGIRYEID